MDGPIGLRWRAQPLGEPESAAEPFNRFGHISVDQDRNNRAGRRGTIHECTAWDGVACDAPVDGAASEFKSAFPLMLPQPVHASQPGPDE